MYKLKKIGKIKSKIEACIKELSKYLTIKELKTKEIIAGTDKKDRIFMKVLDKEDSERKVYVILDVGGWTELHFILSSDLPKYKNKPQVILFKYIKPKNYKWDVYRYSTRKYKSIENTEVGAVIDSIMDDQFKVGVWYQEKVIELSYSFETDFNIKKIIKELNKFKLLAGKIEKEIPALARDIIKNPKKYVGVDRHW